LLHGYNTIKRDKGIWKEGTEENLTRNRPLGFQASPTMQANKQGLFMYHEKFEILKHLVCFTSIAGEIPSK